jgi:Holliday junction DNA helicase RuvB
VLHHSSLPTGAARYLATLRRQTALLCPGDFLLYCLLVYTCSGKVMAREPILGTNHNEGSDEDRDLRPQRLSEMIGQREVFERLMVALEAAQIRGEALSHVLFDGPPGLGKTTFAMCIPRELGVSVQLTTGPALKAPKDLVPYLTNAEERSVLFIDEIHRMPRVVEEYLYTAMEDFRIDLVLGEGVNARTHNLWLKPFTLVGATTRAGMLSGPLRDRFQIREHLGFYSVGELTEIIRRSSAKLNIPTTEEAAVEIARRSRGTPRIANNRLRWVRDYATSRANGKIDLEIAQAALKMAGVDKLGLAGLDRKYLETIIRVFGGGPAGIEAIAHTMNASPDTLADEVEPYLLRIEMVVRSPRGRIVTAKAYEHLQLQAPPRQDGEA